MRVSPCSLTRPTRRSISRRVMRSFLGSLRIVATLAGEPVRSDMGTLQPELPAPNGGIGVLELHLTGAQALDLGPLQHDARLEALHDLVVVARLAVARNDLASFCHVTKARASLTVNRRGGRCPYRYPAGLTGSPLMRTSKCRWGPVETPVLPTEPMRSPAATFWPTDTASFD